MSEDERKQILWESAAKLYKLKESGALE